MVATLAVIGGTGLSRLFDEALELSVPTPYGPASAPVSIGEVAGREVAFLPRHGTVHSLLPADVPFRANLWALRELGVGQIVAVNAVGSLRREHHRGDLVLCDQFVDRTWGRADTYAATGAVTYVSTADPYCGRMRAVAYGHLSARMDGIHPSGTVVVIQGPRFSTRAESQWFAGQGWDLVNMTAYPEVALARELELCYLNISIVTDHDVGIEDLHGAPGEAVSHEAVLAEMARGIDRARSALEVLAPALADEPSCPCRSAMASAHG